MTLSIVLAIAFCTILVLYLNLKSKYNKLEGEILFSQNGQEVEQMSMMEIFYYKKRENRISNWLSSKHIKNIEKSTFLMCFNV